MAVEIPCASGEIQTSNGLLVPFRRINAEDAVRLQAFHGELSERSIYQRFFAFQPSLGDAQASYFANVDHQQREALVALDPDDADTIAGVVRYDRDPGTTEAEYAAIVTDGWQGQGIGYGLSLELLKLARASGVETLYANVLPGNSAMINLLRDLGPPVRMVADRGFSRLELDLTQTDKGTS